ncbi:MAG: IPT/TIG domain-containing protein, partial [Deltaproteobacteria bacterium]|nr:IPT/TIG domain-containing protein [Deltaproteobacteria bacterium]
IIYTIDFENLAAATAPAQQVVVTDQLSPDLDWSTVELISIGFNKVDLSIPPGLSQYKTTASVATDPNPVHVQAGLNPDTGVMTWLMESVDPVTRGLPEDPIAGFLPPNKEDCGHCGEGYVVFSVMPKKGLSPGTVITNQARIIFDVNPPIDTNTVTNTILLVEPEEGTIGTTLTLAGANFGSKKGKVLIGGIALKVTSWTSKAIQGVMSRVLPPGSCSIVVQPKEPKGATALGLGTFEVKSPEIVRLNKYHGAAGDEVTLVGRFFGTKKGKVLLGGRSCKVVSWTMNPVTGHSEVVFVVPKGLPKGAQDLAISNPVGSAKLLGGFTIE